MEPEAGHIHIVRTGRTIEHRKDIFYLLTKVAPDPFGLTVFKKPLQPLVLEVLDLGFNLLCQLTIVNCLNYHSCHPRDPPRLKRT